MATTMKEWTNKKDHESVNALYLSIHNLTVLAENSLDREMILAEVTKLKYAYSHIRKMVK